MVAIQQVRLPLVRGEMALPNKDSVGAANILLLFATPPFSFRGWPHHRWFPLTDAPSTARQRSRAHLQFSERATRRRCEILQAETRCEHPCSVAIAASHPVKPSSELRPKPGRLRLRSS